MRIDIATLFTDMCDRVLGESIIGRAISGGFIEIYTHDIRLYTEDKHRRVDDKPYGGGTGMVMQAQPIYDCIQAIAAQHSSRPRVIYMSPQGEVLTQEKVRELAAEDGLILLCGHYEGVDRRVLDELGAEELSIGDYVLTGGELPALIVADAVSRLQKGVLPNEDAYSIESHFGGLLEYPQYTRPEVWHGRAVPKPLLEGDHAVIAAWQQRESLKVTAQKRPDMYEKYIAQRTEVLWRSFLREKPNTADGRLPRIVCLGWDEESGERLTRLTVRGKKRAELLSVRVLETSGEELPKNGEYSIVCGFDRVPRCIIKSLRVGVLPLSGLTDELIAKAGFTTRDELAAVLADEAARTGYELSSDMPIAVSEFRLEYKEKRI